MEKKTYYARIVAGLAVVILGILFAVFPWKQKNKNPDINIVGNFEAENFIRAVDLKGSAFAQCKGKMLGAVVPHHMVGGKFIADVFSQAKDIDTVVLIGPNHYEKGTSSIITADSDWVTAKGTVPVNSDFVGDMISKKIASAQNEIIGGDHSVGNIMPFIAYYLPNAKVVPIILKRDIPKNDFENLLQYIANQQKNSHMLIIGSVDFSHYLTEAESEKMDEQTIKAIEEKNYGLISTFHNDNMDSPSSVNALLKVMDLLGGNEMLWQNSNSFKVLGGDINDTTSYFELVFCKDEQ
jgi:AmmeMemoRadiSam system protein B